jgi:protein-disulfide isomerase
VTAGSARRVRTRDWVVVAVVAAIVLGLGGYLLLQPSGDQRAAPADATASADTATSTRPASTDPAPTDPAASPPPTESTRGSSPPPHGSDDGDGVVNSMIQPTVVTETGITDPSKAPPIGPLGDLSRRIKNDPLALGRLDAPVVMVSFEDFRCPFCAQFARTTEPKLIEKYVKAGVLRIEWRDLPIFGPESTQAAIAGRAAARQGKFWQFVHAIYADAPEHGHADLPRATLIDYARQVGVPDIAAFTKALDDPALAKAVNDDLEQGSFLGVPSTPAFVINGYPIVGAQPLTEFTTLIDTVQTLR